MPVTLRDVARLAGVAPSTASRALDPGRSASDHVRERVQAAADQLGYRGNVFARSLRTNRSGLLGLLIPDVRNPFFTSLAYEAEKAAAAAGFSMTMGNADENASSQERYLSALERVHVDGLLLVPQGESNEALREAVAERPTICLDRDAGLGTPVVASDSVTGMHQLIDHVAGLGHQRVGIISGPLRTSTGRARLQAARDRLAEHGLHLRADDVVEGDFRLASGVHGAERLLDRPDRPDVVLAADVLMATGLIAVIRRLGLRLGEDVGIAAFDDDPWFPLFDVPITAVEQNIPELARTAVRALTDVIAGKEARTAPVPTRLITRASLGETGAQASPGAPASDTTDAGTSIRARAEAREEEQHG